MVVGVILDDQGRPICCELWPGNRADVKTLIPVVERMRKRFGITEFCVVADREMVSKEAIEQIESCAGLSYIIGVRMRGVKEIRDEVLSQGGR